MRIYLIRHGQTDNNVRKIIDAVHPGPSLNPTGFAQAEVLITTLADEGIQAVYASDITRAVQTATPLARHMDTPVCQLPGLREIPAGDQEGSTDYGPYVEMILAWRTDLSIARPGAQDGATFFARYDDAIARIGASGHQRVAVFSHGAAIRVWASTRSVNLDFDDQRLHDLNNTQYVLLEGNNAAGWTCLEWAGKPIT